MLASAGTRGPGQHGGGEGVCEEVPAQAALQLQEGGPRVDLGKSSAGGEPSQLLPCHRQPVQLSCQQVKN